MERALTLSPPPPVNVLAVRRPTGPPIPREEPDSQRRPDPREEPPMQPAVEMSARDDVQIEAREEEQEEEDVEDEMPFEGLQSGLDYGDGTPKESAQVVAHTSLTCSS